MAAGIHGQRRMRPSCLEYVVTGISKLTSSNQDRMLTQQVRTQRRNTRRPRGLRIFAFNQAYGETGLSASTVQPTRIAS